MAGNRACVVGPFVVVTGEEEGVVVIDPSDPTEPVVLSSVQLPGWPGGMDAAGNFVFAGARVTRARQRSVGRSGDP